MRFVSTLLVLQVILPQKGVKTWVSNMFLPGRNASLMLGYSS